MSYFNIRVYGLLINDKNELLISDEQEAGIQFSKFPGGGLEFGEGLIEGLKREFIEECNTEINVLSHFYTTDFFEKSSFNESQIISIYYLIEAKHPLALNIKTKPFDFDGEGEILQSFRWMKLDNISIKDVTFKTDKTVVSLLKERIDEFSKTR